MFIETSEYRFDSFMDNAICVIIVPVTLYWCNNCDCHYNVYYLCLFLVTYKEYFDVFASLFTFALETACYSNLFIIKSLRTESLVIKKTKDSITYYSL